MRGKEINITLNDNALHSVFAKFPALLCHFLFVREEPPKADADQREGDDQDTNDLTR